MVSVDLLDDFDKLCKIELTMKNNSPLETIVDFITDTIKGPKFKSTHTTKKPMELIRRLAALLNIEGLNKASPYFFINVGTKQGPTINLSHLEQRRRLTF